MRFLATILAAVATMSMAAHGEVTMGDDGLHKTDWLEDIPASLQNPKVLV